MLARKLLPHPLTPEGSPNVVNDNESGGGAVGSLASAACAPSIPRPPCDSPTAAAGPGPCPPRMARSRLVVATSAACPIVTLSRGPGATNVGIQAKGAPAG